MSRTNPFTRINPQHAILFAGVLVALFAVMFRPTGAVADLPSRAIVFDSWNGDATKTVQLGDLSQITREYDVIPTGKGKPVASKLTGVPLVELLKKAGADLENVGFARVRLNTDNDSRISLVPLYTDKDERPPLVLASGKVGSRAIGTPALVPAQPEANKPISQDNFSGFSKEKPYIQVLPSKPGAKIISVKISKSKKGSGQYRLTANRMNGSDSAASYEWFQTDAKGEQKSLGNSQSVTTTATGNKEVVVNVVVTESSTGSMGMAGMDYIPKSDEKGKTTNPGGGSGSGSGTGSGTGTGSGSGTGTGSGAITTTPTPYRPPTTTPQSPQTPSTPQPPTTPEQPTTTPPATAEMDTSAITNVAQNVTGIGGLRMVSGVLLSSPTAAPAGGGGSGAPIGALPAPVADELSSIFQPVDDAEDVWAYLLAILFAFTISGAVREWVKP